MLPMTIAAYSRNASSRMAGSLAGRGYRACGVLPPARDSAPNDLAVARHFDPVAGVEAGAAGGHEDRLVHAIVHAQGHLVVAYVGRARDRGGRRRAIDRLYRAVAGAKDVGDRVGRLALIFVGAGVAGRAGLVRPGTVARRFRGIAGFGAAAEDEGGTKKEGGFHGLRSCKPCAR